jgi:hypothetical protein
MMKLKQAITMLEVILHSSVRLKKYLNYKNKKNAKGYM